MISRQRQMCLCELIYTQFNKYFIQIIQFSQKNISILVSEIWFRSVFSPRATVCLVFVPK